MGSRLGLSACFALALSGAVASEPQEETKRHWAFEPVRPAAPPTDRGSPIDAFLQAGLRERGLTPLGPADKRTVIRRATYDLIGLPPTPEQVDAFLADDSPGAFATLVDRLLESPHYGERWGRHWLDVVRYADTAGENSDHPLPHAWRYRNWVIEAFNRDQPYDEFLREQIAGDILAKQGPPERYAGRVVATGYLAIARRFGHDIDKDMHLTVEDAIDTLGKSVLGLTLACTRCHDHKYDPISTEDYYALYGIFASTTFAFPGCEPKQQPRDLVSLLPPAEWDRVVKPYQERLAGLDEHLRRLNDELDAAVKPLKDAAARSRQEIGRGRVDDGAGQDLAGDPIEIRVGQMLQLSISPGANHGADSTRVEFEVAEEEEPRRRWSLSKDVVDDLLAGNPHGDRHGNAGVWCFLDARDGPRLLREPLADLSGKSGLHVWRDGDTPSVFVNAGDRPIEAWTTLPPRAVFAHPAPDGPVAVGWLSPIDGVVRVSGRIADAHPGGDGVGWLLERVAVDLASGLRAAGETLPRIAAVARERSDLAAHPPANPVAYAVREGQAKNARVHQRGDPEKPGPEVPRRWLGLFGGASVPPDAGSGRLRLAEWITRADNPLTARVMVNRIWHHHFGKGLVATPNDFGTRGRPPTHPELLDWLAGQFMRSAWSVKRMHRLVMLTQAYQRSCVGPDAGALERDPGNEFCWRFDRRRLGAEEIRDSLLTASGRLDPTPGESHPFPPEKSWNFTQHNPFNAVYETRKRSVYLLVPRNHQHPFMALFDGADPNASTPQRQASTVPTQALYFMNDPFFHEQSERFAERLPAGADEDARLAGAFRLAFQRGPTPQEVEKGRAFLAGYAAELADLADADRPRAAWAAFARVLLGGNEFLYLE